ncbi:MAG: hypothetical protein JWQ62_52, partial [Lacunisphaera sp.]|nr:hypothetical protein [Lacunisphaera sp.]
DLALRRLNSATFDLAVRVRVYVEKGLDLSSGRIDRSATMPPEDTPETHRVFHETKFVFLSCARLNLAAVLHTVAATTFQEAWAAAPEETKRETTHLVRCDTEILRLKSH